MASITDCVVEGLKYPFNDIKKFLGFGVLLALVGALSTYIGFISLRVLNTVVRLSQMNNTTVTNVSFSQLPLGDIYLAAVLAIVMCILSLFALGYQYDIVKFSIERKKDLPGFTNILAMFANGIKYFIVTLAYTIIPMIVLVGGTALAGDSSVLPIIVLISVLLFIMAYFLLIMALNNMIAYDSIKKAFDFGEIIDNISNLGWGKYVGIILFTVIVMMIVSVAVSFILSLIAALFSVAVNNQAVIVSLVIAIIEGLFLDSYMALFFNRVCGSVYRESIK
ncbi:DUF4013 domain-containing protein [Methanobrevibacter sp.]